MKKTLLAVTMAALTLPMTSQAAESGLEISGNFGLTSNYKFRGISQTDNKPAAQGGFDLAHSSGLYIGTWTSNVSDWANAAGNGQEIDLYAGYSTELPLGLGIDVGALKYYYPNNQAGQNTL
ncbi:MAG: TorF family putative porin, partial [Burkholderiaceae bacterium]